jgi:glyoxylase-like metal-dependent hydrolase (beta-lactamase superfamily II)
MRRFGLSIALFLLSAGALIAQTPQSMIQTGDPYVRGLKESDFPRLKKLTDNVYTYEALRAGDKDRFMTTNSLIVVTTDGVVIVDGQGNTKQLQEMLDKIKTLTPQPVKYMIIGSDHGDHTGGNSILPKDVILISSEISKKTLETQAANQGRRGGNAAPPRIPTETVADKRTLKVGNTEFQLMFLGPAHTGGDMEVYLPKEKVLFMSEVYLHRIFPAMRSAVPSSWVQVIKKSEKINATWYIPGHGFIDDPKTLKNELVTYEHAMEAVIAEATRLHNMGLSVDDAVKQANWGPYKDWTLRAGQEKTAIQRVYDELDGKLKTS